MTLKNWFNQADICQLRIKRMVSEQETWTFKKMANRNVAQNRRGPEVQPRLVIRVEGESSRRSVYVLGARSKFFCHDT
jgi:hypothetical protein